MNALVCWYCGTLDQLWSHWYLSNLDQLLSCWYSDILVFLINYDHVGILNQLTMIVFVCWYFGFTFRIVLVFYYLLINNEYVGILVFWINYDHVGMSRLHWYFGILICWDMDCIGILVYWYFGYIHLWSRWHVKIALVCWYFDMLRCGLHWNFSILVLWIYSPMITLVGWYSVYVCVGLLDWSH